MTRKRHYLLGSLTLIAGLFSLSASADQKEVTIAYQDMVVPWRVAHEAGELEKATGYKINFRQFAGGGDVIRALASGQVSIGEAGSAPIASAISQGLPIELFWILDDINEAEALVARDGSNVNSVADLKGKKIGVPFTSTTHFHTLVALQHARVNPNDVQILNLRPPEIAAAWERGNLDATFIWDPVLSKVKKSGKVLTTSGEISKQTGKTTFDGIVVNQAWAKDNADFLVKFVKVLAKADENYRKNKAKWTADSAEAKAVAKISGAKVEDVPATIALYRFPTLDEQASSRWLGGGKDGGAAQSLLATANFLKSQGTSANVLTDYSANVTPVFVQKAAK
ncbi:taurine ABC transporter substrate-binding protein [Rhodocyclus tenuis]|uniref:taurine ABC transporter substrate-binding protein n=1 Tax=Rhodocyclus gracilis TaxID=2929842 RepID=UPI001298ADB1|nr:taurine ABC transporter substrate-binding protein [Rhodocyclus gracilis]MRD71986.1 taurine ABC transporter substrate-binding protein [Rhodocyclus gracilis]